VTEKEVGRWGEEVLGAPVTEGTSQERKRKGGCLFCPPSSMLAVSDFIPDLVALWLFGTLYLLL